jgi:YjbE family integral membrane protein
MEWFSMEFLSALLAIIVIDLVLAGDNAIVIALAARNVPRELRKRAIVWGTFGAIAVRTAMTLTVVWLLKIPGLLLIGGLLLVWIAYKLIIDNDEGDGHRLDAANSFWGAMKTIIAADALMGLDNVLAVAGAAQGSFLLVVLGLLVSIPIVIGGSQIILKFVERYPGIVYLGAGVLAWTAVKMVAGEPLLAGFLAEHRPLVWAAYIAVIGGVLSAGFLVNHRKVKARVAAHLVDVSFEPALSDANPGIKLGGAEMVKLLIPIDGSPNSLKAVQHVMNQFLANPSMEVHLLHVRTPFSRHIARFLNRRDLAAFHRDEADKALRPARAMLDHCRVPYAHHVEFGDKAAIIANVARRLHVDQIVMGTARKNSFTRMVEDSVTNKVLELAQMPVEVIAGDSVSTFERYGVPVGIGAALALLYVAAD